MFRFWKFNLKKKNDELIFFNFDLKEENVIFKIIIKINKYI